MTNASGETAAPRRIACMRCGTAFECRPGGGCWCAEAPLRLPLPSLAGDDCLCPACLRAAARGAGAG